MKLRYFFILAFSVVCSRSAVAQWHSDSTTNTPVCTASGIQDAAQSCSDGANGVIVAWEDHRSGNGWDIWAQRLDANGNPMWGQNGAPVCRVGNSDQRYPLIASDGSGGAYIVWEDNRTTANGIDLYGQHLSSSGARTYDTSGVAVAVAVRDQNNAAITSDGFGNAFVAWEDNRSTSSPTRPDIYMNKLTSSGAAWGSSGALKINQSSQQRGPRLCEDGSGGCVLAWQTSSTIPQSIWASRISSGGSILWGTQGCNVYIGSVSTNLSRNIDLRRDGSEFMIAWEETTSAGQEIRANRLQMDSTKDWYSPADITWGFAGDQINPKVFSDDSAGSGTFTNPGLLVLFENYTGGTSVEMVRVLPNGADLVPRAGTNFFDVCAVTGGQATPVGAKVGSGILMAAWEDARNGANDSAIYAQCVDIAPRRYFPIAGTSSLWGQPIRTSTSTESRNVSLVPTTNGAIAVWEDNRNGNWDIYAQLVFKNGTLPVEMASFNATAHGPKVDLNWQTASEQSNAGFVIERRLADQSSSFESVQSFESNPALHGHGPTSVTHYYSAVDYPKSAGTYEYRIIDVALDGSRTEHPSERVEVSQVMANGFAVMQNQPNPMTDHATISFTLERASMVDLTLMDVLGRVVAQPLVHQFFAAGGHATGFDLTQLNRKIASGTYLYRLTASDPSTGSILWQNDRAMTMQIVK